jgi:transcriptional regulator with XRE-family HTH domain
MNRFSTQKLPVDLLRQIADNHRAIRRGMKMSQSDLAERSGVSLGSIKRFEASGKISLESLLKLALVLNRLTDFDKIFALRLSPDVDKLFSDKMRKS